MKRFAVIAIALAAASCGGKDVAGVETPVPDTIPVVFPGGTIAAKIASTVTTRANGLMNVTTLGADSGMLFVFATDHAPADCAFWMSDTPTPLSIAFVDANMRVISIQDMAAETTTFHEPPSACRYALETNLGWFSTHGVVTGSTVAFALPAGTVVDP